MKLTTLPANATFPLPLPVPQQPSPFCSSSAELSQECLRAEQRQSNVWQPNWNLLDQKRLHTHTHIRTYTLACGIPLRWTGGALLGTPESDLGVHVVRCMRVLLLFHVRESMHKATCDALAGNTKRALGVKTDEMSSNKERDTRTMQRWNTNLAAFFCCSWTLFGLLYFVLNCGNIFKYSDVNSYVCNTYVEFIFSL